MYTIGIMGIENGSTEKVKLTSAVPLIREMVEISPTARKLLQEALKDPNAAAALKVQQWYSSSMRIETPDGHYIEISKGIFIFPSPNHSGEEHLSPRCDVVEVFRKPTDADFEDNNLVHVAWHPEGPLTRAAYNYIPQSNLR